MRMGNGGWRWRRGGSGDDGGDGGSSGGGSGAIIQVIVGANGTVTAPPTVIQGGFNYTSVPNFTLAAGGTPATFVAQLSTTPNTIISADQQAVSGVGPVQGLNPQSKAITASVVRGRITGPVGVLGQCGWSRGGWPLR